MAVVAIGTLGGLTDPGTICLHVAALWPHPPTVVEADPDGGRLAVRHNWDLRPSLADLASSIRSGAAPRNPLESIAHRLRSGVRVVTAPPAAESVGAALPVLTNHLLERERAESESPTDVLIVVGVVRPDTPARDLIVAATRRILVVRKDEDEVVALAHRRSVLESMGDWVVLTAGGRLRTRDVVTAIRWPVIADLLPKDRRNSDILRASLARLAASTSRSPQMA